VSTTVATASFGAQGGALLNALMTISICGALGGLVMTQPRLFYTLAAQHADGAPGMVGRFFSMLARVSPRTSVPTGSILFTTAASLAALVFFGSFSRLVNFATVPLQVAVIFMVGAVFRLRKRYPDASGYRTPGYPLTPLVFMVVMSGFVVSATVFRPIEPLIGIALGASGGIVYWRLLKARVRP
jgi:APA family basic amino acid/polyamine antiporter